MSGIAGVTTDPNSVPSDNFHEEPYLMKAIETDIGDLPSPVDKMNYLWLGYSDMENPKENYMYKEYHHSD